MVFDWNTLADIGLDVAKAATAGTPVGLAVNVLDAVVDNVNEGNGVMDQEVLDLLEVAAKSSHNKVDDKLLCIVRAYLECDNANNTN